MTVTYNMTAINNRLNGVVDAIDAPGGNADLVLRDASNGTLSTINLARPCGIVDSGILVFSGQLLDPAATGTGLAENGIIQDSDGTMIVSGLSVGVPLSGCDIILSNGLNSTLITAGQTVELLSAQITGS